MLFTTQDSARRKDNQPTVPTTIESKSNDPPLFSTVYMDETKPPPRTHIPSKHGPAGANYLKERVRGQSTKKSMTRTSRDKLPAITGLSYVEAG